MRPVYLSRVDIRQAHDRGTGAITLRYVGKKLRFYERLFGYADGTFFAVVISEVPLPEALVALASEAGVDIGSLPSTGELRQAVAEVLACEALIEAPEYLNMCAEPRCAWVESDVRDLEHRMLAAEQNVRQVSATIEATLRRRMAKLTRREEAPIRTYAPMPPAGFGSRFASLPPVVAPVREPEVVEVEEEEEVEDGPVETSDATGRRALAAVKIAREQELPQRLPGGARRALGHLPPGIYVAHGAALDRKADVCSAMVEGAESGKRAGEAAVIDWDGEWPVVVRRYGSHGRIVYRVEEALRRYGISEEAA